MTPEQPDKLEVGEKDEAGKTKLEAAESGPQGVCNCPLPPVPPPRQNKKRCCIFLPASQQAPLLVTHGPPGPVSHQAACFLEPCV